MARVPCGLSSRCLAAALVEDKIFPSCSFELREETPLSRGSDEMNHRLTLCCRCWGLDAGWDGM